MPRLPNSLPTFLLLNPFQRGFGTASHVILWKQLFEVTKTPNDPSEVLFSVLTFAGLSVAFGTADHFLTHFCLDVQDSTLTSLSSHLSGMFLFSFASSASSPGPFELGLFGLGLGESSPATLTHSVTSTSLTASSAGGRPRASRSPSAACPSPELRLGHPSAYSILPLRCLIGTSHSGCPQISPRASPPSPLYPQSSPLPYVHGSPVLPVLVLNLRAILGACLSSRPRPTHQQTSSAPPFKTHP